MDGDGSGVFFDLLWNLEKSSTGYLIASNYGIFTEVWLIFAVNYVKVKCISK